MHWYPPNLASKNLPNFENLKNDHVPDLPEVEQKSSTSLVPSIYQYSIQYFAAVPKVP